MIYCSYSHMLIDYVSSDEERGHTVTRMSRLPGNISVKTRNMQYAVFIGFYKTLKGQNACAPSQGIKTLPEAGALMWLNDRTHVPPVRGLRLVCCSIPENCIGQNAFAPSQGIFGNGLLANVDIVGKRKLPNRETVKIHI